MRCHYDILEVERTATNDDIKKQYRKLALKLHPDRNIGNEEAATESFKLVTSAYTVLSDPNERQWYDDHREAILRGGNGTRGSGDDEEYTANLWKYFNSGCYNGFEDTSSGFYNVYSTIFNRLWKDERENDGKYEIDEPTFGQVGSLAADVLRFYNYWLYFTSTRSFSWEDKYNVNDAPNRHVRRAIDKENLKQRDVAKKAYNSLVQSLVKYVKKRDPRIVAIEIEAAKKFQEEEEKRSIQRKEMKEKKKEKKAMNRQLFENDEEELERRATERQRAFLLADDSEVSDDDDSADIDEQELLIQQSIRDNAAAGIVDGDDDVEEVQECYSCEACEKEFKTELQLNQHKSSKVHRKRVQDLEKKLKADKSSKGSKKSTITTSKTASDDMESEVVEDVDRIIVDKAKDGDGLDERRSDGKKKACKEHERIPEASTADYMAAEEISGDKSRKSKVKRKVGL